MSDKTVAKELPEFCEIQATHAAAQEPAVYEMNEEQLKMNGSPWHGAGIWRYKPDGSKRKYDDFDYIYICATCHKSLGKAYEKVALPVAAEAADPMTPQTFVAEKRTWVKVQGTFFCEVTPSGVRGAKDPCSKRALYTVDPKRTSNPDAKYPITGEALYLCPEHALTLRVATGGFGGTESQSPGDLQIVFDIE